MIAIDWLFDGVLGALLLTLATAALHARSLYTSIILFIAFGLLLAVTWARLGAPDLALAEAAIGAGLTGALLLAAFARAASESVATAHSFSYLITALFTLLVLGVLLPAVWPLPDRAPVLPQMALAQLDASGVRHPLTAVLLNYRAWDTLLELVVLLLALLGVRQLRQRQRETPAPWPLLLAWTKLLAPLTVMVGGFLLWRGAYAPGGAFQAGALLAAGAVVLRLNRLLPPLDWQHWLLRSLVLVGLVTFLSVGIICMLLESGWMHYPANVGGALVLLIEVAATLSIATTLTLLIVGENRELGA